MESTKEGINTNTEKIREERANLVKPNCRVEESYQGAIN